MMGDKRGRLTVPDVLFLLMSLAFFAPLTLVFYDGLDMSASYLGTGTGYLYQLLPPLAILVLLSVVYVKSIGGSA
jgi:hypothetical protein